MKRSDFLKHLIKSFGGEQEFADELKNTLTNNEYSAGDNDRWQLWGTILSMLDGDSVNPFSMMMGGMVTEVKDDRSVQTAIQQFRRSKECAMLGEAGQRVIEAFEGWAKGRGEEGEKVG